MAIHPFNQPAIDAAAADATSKANAAKSDAVNTASADATNKANAVKSDATSAKAEAGTAKSDATTAKSDATTAMQKVDTLSATMKGGARRPYRVFKNVGTTAVLPDVTSSGAAEITDPFGEGLKYAIRSVSIKTIAAPTLAATISIGTNAAADNVFTKVIVLASIPVVGNTLELLGLAGTTLPSDVTLPATLKAKATAGVFEIIIDGILK